MSLSGAPTTAEGMFNCSNNKLETLYYAPEIVRYKFDCSNNQIRSLFKGPLIVDSSYDCSSNLLPDLVGAPSRVLGHFNCKDNILLTSLKGIPKYIEGNFIIAPNTFTEREIRALSNIEGSVLFRKKNEDDDTGDD